MKKAQSRQWQGVTIPQRFEINQSSKRYLRLQLAEPADRSRFEFSVMVHSTAKMLMVSAFVEPWRGEYSFQFPKARERAAELIKQRESYSFNSGCDLKFYHASGAMVFQAFLDELDAAIGQRT